MLNRKLLAAALVLVLVASTGCSILGGQQKQPTPTNDDIRQMVLTEIRSPEMKTTIQSAVATDQLRPMITQVLESQDGKKAVQTAVTEAMSKPEIQAQLTSQIQKALQSPQGKQMLSQAIESVISEIIRKGAAAAAQGGGQQQSGGQQGGGQQSGAGGGGGGGGS